MEIIILTVLTVAFCIGGIHTSFTVNEIRYTPVHTKQSWLYKPGLRYAASAAYLIIFAAATWKLWDRSDSGGLAACAVILAALVKLALSDLMYRRLPNDQLLLLGIGGVFYLTQTAYLGMVIMNAVMAFCLVCLLLLSAWIVNSIMQRILKTPCYCSIGAGDIKMLALLALIFGWLMADILLVSSVMALVVLFINSLYMYRKTGKWRIAGSCIAFGWVMSAAAVIKLM